MAHLSNKKYIWALPILVIIIILFILFKPSSPDTVRENIQPIANNQVQKIRIAVPDLSSSDKSSSGTPLIDNLYLNQLLQQEFAADNIQVEWQFFKGAGPVINEALANKQLDFAFLGDLAAIIGKANNIDTTLLVATGRKVNSYLGVLPNHDYSSLEKLKGKRIAVWQGTAHQLAFTQFIHSYGYSEKDFRIVNLDPAATNAALAAKQIDAGWGLIPILALKQQGLVDIPLSTLSRSDGQGTIQSGLIGRTEFIKQHPEIVQKLVTAVVKSAHWVSAQEHREQAIELVTKNVGYPIQLYKLNLENQDLKEIYSPLLDDFYLSHFQSGVDSALKAQLIRQGFDVKQWANPYFVNTAIQQLKYEHYWDKK